MGNGQGNGQDNGMVKTIPYVMFFALEEPPLNVEGEVSALADGGNLEKNLVTLTLPQSPIGDISRLPPRSAISGCDRQPSPSQ